MGQQLEVRLYGAHLGSVEQDSSGRLSFTYELDDDAARNAVPLSLSMPLGTPRYPASKIRPFLDGLLPDNVGVRESWARRFGVSPENPFALLRHIGRDCAGAVELLAEGELADAGASIPVTTAEIGQRIRFLAADPSGWQVAGERWSLAGAQSKFALARRADGQWVETRGSEPSTHIIKPGIAAYRSQALVEHVSMRSARAVGLRAAKTEYLDFDGAPALVVTRFDRRRSSEGSIVRVHQEDLCQALAVYPRRKYESDGGPTAADIARLLRDNSTDGDADVWEFVQALIFNYLIGAPDAHAKNYSVMHAPGLTRITPMYDVASALPYEADGVTELDTAAMSIGGRRRFGTVHGRHWDKLAADVKLDTDRLREEVRRQAEAIPGVVAGELAMLDAPELREHWMPRLEQGCAAAVTQLRD